MHSVELFPGCGGREKNVPDRNMKEEAEALSFALESGFATLDQVKDWAYSRIAADEKPSEALLGLTAPNLHPTDAVHGLRAVSGRPRDVETLGGSFDASVQPCARSRISMQRSHVRGPGLPSMRRGVPVPVTARRLTPGR
jgi:hypothetical protein